MIQQATDSAGGVRAAKFDASAHSIQTLVSAADTRFPQPAMSRPRGSDGSIRTSTTKASSGLSGACDVPAASVEIDRGKQ